MDITEHGRRPVKEEESSSQPFTLEEFLGAGPEEFLAKKERYSVFEDFQQLVEERKLYAFGAEKEACPKEVLPKNKGEGHLDVWAQKKRKKHVTLFQSYIQKERKVHQDQAIFANDEGGMRPQKMCLGVIKKAEAPQEKDIINTILPLYLNATTSFEGSSQKLEFLKISTNFVSRVEGIDYDALTVQQLKGIMKEFGLNYTGRKQELIARVQQTYQKIRAKQDSEKVSYVQEYLRPEPTKSDNLINDEHEKTSMLFF
ncbi:hypothetical protein NEDG_01041 [Nematocida displodere]|uniref:SAP domain-containing protein n=1 Tax=Nematocida displodere TaxID=1805483 RepID=A0A177ECL6_9MICR|nr:hypothetical protein NEDG_01041 [Nematocida displodere]